MFKNLFLQVLSWGSSEEPLEKMWSMQQFRKVDLLNDHRL